MAEYNNILVPRDYSPCSDTAFAYAGVLARHFRAAVTTVFAEVVHGPYEAEEPLLRAEHRELREPIVDGHHLVRRSLNPADAILDTVQEISADLVVMGTHGRRGLTRLLLGSVAERVVKEAACPVITVRVHEEQIAWKLPNRIIVPLEFTPQDYALLNYADELAQAFNACLTAIHVVDEQLVPAIYAPETAAVMIPMEDRQTPAHERLIQLTAELDLKSPCEAVTRVGDTVEEVTAVAYSDATDLILTGITARHGIGDLLFGNSLLRIVRTAHCPVMTIKLH